MELLGLPSEMLVAIAQRVDDWESRVRFGQASRRLYALSEHDDFWFHLYSITLEGLPQLGLPKHLPSLWRLVLVPPRAPDTGAAFMRGLLSRWGDGASALPRLRSLSVYATYWADELLDDPLDLHLWLARLRLDELELWDTYNNRRYAGYAGSPAEWPIELCLRSVASSLHHLTIGSADRQEGWAGRRRNAHPAMLLSELTPLSGLESLRLVGFTVCEAVAFRQHLPLDQNSAPSLRRLELELQPFDENHHGQLIAVLDDFVASHLDGLFASERLETRRLGPHHLLIQAL